MKTQAELRAFMYGILAGVAILAGSFAGISEIAGLKWQPVKVEQR